MSPFQLVLVSLACAVTLQGARADSATPRDPQSAARAAPSANAIARVEVERMPDGGWLAIVDYEYSGTPEQARLVIKQFATQTPSNVEAVPERAAEAPLQVGRHQARLRLKPAGDESYRFTQSLTAEIVGARETAIASATLVRLLEWPDAEAARMDADIASKPPRWVLARAAALIDTNEPSVLAEAKLLLERLLRRDPKQDQAYLELARIAMKSQWGPDGLRQAEALIQSALQLRPDSADAKILLGYVYTNQGRTSQAEAAFKDAARAGTRNLWLWSNWGELLLAQHRDEQAIEKFRFAIAQPRSREPSDQARLQAYGRLLQVYGRRGDLDAMEALHRQRHAEYPEVGCPALSYARFLVTMRGDAARAEEILKNLPPTSCESGEGRMLVALVRYVAWAGAAPPQKAEALRRARVELPVGPRLFHLLAESDRTAAVAKQLVAAGEDVSMQDNNRMDALAYALTSGDAAAAGRLLAAGARPDSRVGPEQMPVALVPVLMGDTEAVALLQRAGVNYSQLRFRGLTALEVARQRHDEAMVRALGRRASRL